LGEHRLRQTEVEDFHFSAGSELDVGRFQIAVDDAPFVRGFQGIGHLQRDAEHLPHGNRTGLEAILQGRALDQLEDEAVRLSSFLEAVNGADMRVIERRENLRLTLETLDAVWIGRE
jgi:hypothetical protein